MEIFYTKEIVCFNIHPEMSVSKARWAMKAGLEIKKENVQNKIHVQFNIQNTCKETDFSFEGL